MTKGIVLSAVLGLSALGMACGEAPANNANKTNTNAVKPATPVAATPVAPATPTAATPAAPAAATPAKTDAPKTATPAAAPKATK